MCVLPGEGNTPVAFTSEDAWTLEAGDVIR